MDEGFFLFLCFLVFWGRFAWVFLSGVCLPTVATMSFGIHNVMCCSRSPNTSVILGQLCQNERKKKQLLSALHLKTTGMTCANSLKKNLIHQNNSFFV